MMKRFKISEKSIYNIRKQMMIDYPEYTILGMRRLLHDEFGLYKTIRRMFTEYYKILDEKKFAIFKLKYGHLFNSP